MKKKELNEINGFILVHEIKNKNKLIVLKTFFEIYIFDDIQIKKNIKLFFFVIAK